MLRAATLSLFLPFSAVSQDGGMPLDTGQVGIEYIAHACFRIHTSGGTRILVDPYASRDLADRGGRPEDRPHRGQRASEEG